MAKVRGMQNVVSNMNRQVNAIYDRSQRGLNKAALVILRESNRLVPVNTGNLRGSGFFEPVQSGPPAVIVAYQAEYAVYVHEDLEARYRTGQAKFLETAIRNEQDRALAAIEDEARFR